MILLSAMYPSQGSSKFDLEYYLRDHLRLVRERWEPMGLQDIRIVRGLGTPDGSPPLYQVMALLSFDTMEHLQDAVGTHGPEVLGDIPNFSDVQPVIQVSEQINESQSLSTLPA